MRMRATDRRAGVAGVVVALVVGVGLPALAAEQPGDDPIVRTAADGSVTYRDPSLAHEDTTTVEGRLRQVADERPGAEPTSVLTTDDGDVVPVSIDPSALEEATSGAPVTAKLVNGTALDSALDGEQSAPVEVASARFAAVAATPTPRAHRAYVAVITNSGSKNLASSSALATRLDRGLKYWRTEANEAITSFKRAAKLKRYASKLGPQGRCGFSNPTSLWKEAARKFPTVNFNAAGNHLIVLVSDKCSDSTGGIGTIGSSVGSGGLVTMGQQSSIFTATLAHELGHNLSLDHANLCVSGCASPDEYMNLYSVMGLAVSSRTPLGPTALDTVYRRQLGIVDEAEVEIVPSGQSVTRALSPRGATTGLRGLQVPVGGTTYWIDFRSGTGRDASSYYAAAKGTDAIGSDYTYPFGVTIERQATGSKESTVLLARSNGAGALTSGGITVNGVTVTVGSVGSKATVTVTNNATVVGSLSPGTPTIMGTARKGQTLTADPGTWTPEATTYSYRWLVNGAPIAGATSSTYAPGASRVGKRISVQVTGYRTGYTSTVGTSASTAPVKD